MKLTIDFVREHNPVLAHSIVKIARERRISVDDALLFLLEKALMPTMKSSPVAG